ncbi:MAG: hypothetical protein JO359_01530, partial [Candidatus Eremiobacteraeota bacterium]|nr:hypothetical protein [Candidatus Eremiobacteraeota bacterium]
MSVRAALAMLLAVCGSLCATALPARANGTITLHAKRINFFVERLAVIADGGVRTTYPGGPSVSADSLYVDLRGDRYLWCGHVHAVREGRTLDAAALAIERDSETVYALREDELPRVERYQRFDLGGGEVVGPPGDAFVFPPLREFRPYIFSSTATIVPKVNIRFTPALFPTSAGIVVPSPSYLYSYVPNPNFGASALAGSNFDQPYGLLGSERALTSAHFRYDSHYGAGIALTQQFVYGDRGYVAMGLGPLRRGGDTASLLAYQRIDALRSQTLSGSSQNGLQQVQYRFNQGVRHGLLTFTAGQANAQGTVDLGWTSDPYPIARSGFSFRLHADYGFD